MHASGVSRSAAVLTAVVALSVAGCEAPAAPQIVSHRLSQPLSGPCPTTGTAQGEFASEVTEFGATITGPDISEALQSSGTSAITIDGVPAGDNRIISLFGFVNGQPRWRGVSQPTTLVDGTPTEVNVVLAAVADFSCARSAAGGHAFHTATPLDDGKVLIVGGADEMADASASCANLAGGGGGPCLKARATAAAAVYDPSTGVFEPVGRMITERMFHTATRLADGRVVIAGGSSEATFFNNANTRHPFPVVPEGPIAAIEIYDPATKQFSSAGNDPGGPRIFAAAVTTLDGNVLITGGIPSKATGTAADDLGNALDTTTLCDGSTCVAGPTMNSHRAGHVAFATDPQGVYVWGGAINQPEPAGTEASQKDDEKFFRVDYLAPEAGSTFQHLTRSSVNTRKNFFFAGFTSYLEYRHLLAGGVRRLTDGGVVTFTSADTGGVVFDVDATDDGNRGGASGVVGMQSPRLFASVATLPNKSALVVGGFDATSLTNINWTAVGAVDVYDEEALRAGATSMTTIRVSGADRTTREPRGGATATGIGDGTVVIVGGYVNNNSVAESAEVFADQRTPPQAAEFVR